jgi:hypothetical protein
MKEKILYTTVAVLAAVSMFLLGMSWAPQAALAPGNSSPEAGRSVSVLLDSGTKVSGFQNVTIPQAEPTVLGVLKSVAAEHNLTLDVDASSSMGAFIKQIGSQKNGAGARYWQYWVNGVQPLVAADKLPLSGGETILWTFRQSQM